MRSRPCAVAAVAMFAALIGSAHAQPSDDDDDQKARELFRLGESHYAAGRYENAAVLYDEAYRLSGRADLLLAMVNTYERMGDYAKAIEKLRLYIKHPKAKNVASLRERVRRLEQAERERKNDRERLRELETAEKEREREVQHLREENRRRRSSGEDRDPEEEDEDRGPSRKPAYLLLGGGAVAVTGAIVFGIASNSAGNDAEAECGGGLCTSDAPVKRELAFAILADASAVIGIAAGATGAYLLWKRRAAPREQRSALRIEPVVVPGGWGVGLAGDL